MFSAIIIGIIAFALTVAFFVLRLVKLSRVNELSQKEILRLADALDELVEDRIKKLDEKESGDESEKKDEPEKVIPKPGDPLAPSDANMTEFGPQSSCPKCGSKKKQKTKFCGRCSVVFGTAPNRISRILDGGHLHSTCEDCGATTFVRSLEDKPKETPKVKKSLFQKKEVDK